ncbi:putative NADPH-dependent FMN reductase [Actinoplanes missouriensis 431]|uniref:Putative NADPH-dependent FMN reductase n=1 Tax=Actinoplanes missouriensis (strain ATCC 14538 / DSM 43046 / CBS 188.64 / JCM 3121 / NBRC 102363 / NCIMB 12654 / NRRL B-3342 / UNCC 431) TaxID=512565 RepID=I0HFI5_ACTM4|nr:NAD(P)H-dependent oxidoreductase [Actinoplanes missouriensis]BAL91772.1 putative NADPH-dependent FMN reductase [Actinoplanes missouriensis 431]
MTGILVISGNPRSGSRTSVLATAVGAAIAARIGSPDPHVIEVGDLGAGLLTPGDDATRTALAAIAEANLLVVATPTYKGSYTGVLKVLLDQLPAQALAGKLAVPVVTAGVAPQAAAAEALLRQLLVELGAIAVRPGLPVVEADLAETAEIAQKYAAALDW